jgi:hypothetical protein
MKKLLAALIPALLCFTASSAPPFTGQTNWLLSWTITDPAMLATQIPYTNYIPKTNQAWNVYGTTNLGLSIANWPIVGLLTNWTYGNSYFTSSIALPYSGQWFLTLVPTNFQGEAKQLFCTPDQTGPLPTPAANENLIRGQ